jgi:hypothetical protein
LKIALIMSMPLKGAHQFGWIWRAEHGSDGSSRTFTYFHDCLEDARAAGYTCRFEAGAAAPASRRRSGNSAGQKA